MNQQQICVLGIGSAYGDDQAGWLVIDLLQSALGGHHRLRKLAAPMDMVHEIDPSIPLVIVDAALDIIPLLRCWNVIKDQNGTIEIRDSSMIGLTSNIPLPSRTHSTHGLGVDDALRLTGTLGLLPANVTFWTIGIKELKKTEFEVSEETVRLCKECARNIVLQCRRLRLHVGGDPNLGRRILDVSGRERGLRTDA